MLQTVHKCYAFAARYLSEFSTSSECQKSLTIPSISYVQAEIEQLRLELQSTIVMHKEACEELVRTQIKVQVVSLEYAEETKKVKAALEREDTMTKIAAEEKARYLKAVKEVDKAKSLLTRETYDRQIAKLNGIKKSIEKQKLVDALYTGDKRY